MSSCRFAPYDAGTHAALKEERRVERRRVRVLRVRGADDAGHGAHGAVEGAGHARLVAVERRGRRRVGRRRVDVAVRELAAVALRVENEAVGMQLFWLSRSVILVVGQVEREREREREQENAERCKKMQPFRTILVVLGC